MEISRRRHPGARHSLDKLAERYRIDTSSRTLHGGLIDADILLEVYLELTGSRRQDLGFDAIMVDSTDDDGSPARKRPTALAPLSTEAERNAHREYIRESIGEHALWLRQEEDNPASEPVV